MSQRSFLIALFAVLAVVLLGMDLDIMEVDAAQYAGMSRDMMLHGNVLELFFRGNDYLDKPPLLFWVSAISFKVFGVHTWSYRLPSVLFAFLGLYSTFRFTRLYHDIQVARLATVIFGCSAAFFLMTNDVRCDTLLTAMVITAVWLGCAWLETDASRYLILCSLAIGAAMLAKGPIGAIAPLCALGGQLLFTGRVKKLFQMEVLLVPLLIAMCLVPMCIGLYGQHGVHGLRFYFWEQSFGRITGGNRWKDDSSVFFFTHELLWQLLPWILFVLIGLWKGLRAMIKHKELPEYASLSGAVLVFLAISLSQFKLPHYLYVALPFFAVLGAGPLAAINKTLAVAHCVILSLLWTLSTALLIVVFPDGRWPFAALSLLVIPITILLFRRKEWLHALPSTSVVVMVSIGLAMNGHFYPNLLRFQANAQAGQWAAANKLDQDHFFGMQVSGTAMDFYAGYPVKWISNADEARSVIAPGVVIYTDGPHRAELINAGLVPSEETILKNYPVQVLGVDFLLPNDRPALLEDRFLLQY
ncbi:MAG: glycosyltransferase family 39 protein [Flavobacteriales bacterium]|nr:glycosyltransferase family 39 protein [Flavobacteriales bacterium]MBP7156072.1 glycosyltransferase family 39 protein [Flavobacteriales bacterium]HQW40860.1 glycosyltransferase family 39 protein [Flavobacteriales bacterium]